MIRSEIIEQFRLDNPEITSRVISDTLLYEMCFTGDKEFCAAVRCIVDQDGKTISTSENDRYFDLASEITKFYDIDDYPGSGVVYNGKRLEKTTMAQLDEEVPTWRDRNSGIPTQWFRRGKYIYLDRKIDSEEDDLIIYSVLISDDWSTDIAPYNALTYLEPFHFGMVLYLQKRAKAKVGKPAEAKQAAAEFSAYVVWAKSQLGGNKFAPIHFEPEQGVYHQPKTGIY